MKISTRGRYALRFMADLAEHGATGFVPLKDISIKYLEQITARLTKSGLLISTRGPQGGYKLAKKAKNYTAMEILQITEGSITPVSCLDDKPVKCDRVNDCRTLKLWLGLQKAIEDYLKSVTLEDLIKEND